MIEPGDEVVIYDWRRGLVMGIASWRVSQVDYAQGVMELDLQPGHWVDMRGYTVVSTKEEVAERMLTQEWR
jgi:hypothetical protein